MKLKHYLHSLQGYQGFILPLTMLVCTIVLIIASGVTTILAKQIYFAQLERQSQAAYYAADNGAMCAVLIDDKYYDPTTGTGIFPYDPINPPFTYMDDVMQYVNDDRADRNLTSFELTDIRCATSYIFNQGGTTNFAVAPFSRINSLGAPESGRSSSFSMRMDLGDGTYRCADITVNKTLHYRQIISRGYATCNENASVRIERAVINTTEDL